MAIIQLSTEDVQIQKLNKTPDQFEGTDGCANSNTETETEQFPTDLFTSNYKCPPYI